MSESPARIDALDRATLRRAAEARFFARGEGYYAEGRVGPVTELDGVISAKVRGTRAYRVKLWFGGDELEYSCTCPVGRDGACCKHCVAVGLAWITQRDSDTHASTKPAKPAVTMKDVRRYLAEQPKDALVDLVMEHAQADERLGRRLLMTVAARTATGLDLATYRVAIDTAVIPDDYVGYAEAYDYARGIEEVIDSIETLLEAGHGAEVIELAEFALARVEEAMQLVDDSDGFLGAVLDRLQKLHYKACRRAKPDPVALAERLFAWELRGEYDTFYGAVATYARVLGKEGLAAYRTLAEREWARVPALGPDSAERSFDGKRFRITHTMETLARKSGDVEAVVAVKSRDLSSAYAYLDTAQTYKDAGKHEQALEWAERGVQAFPERTDDRLREFLAAEYHRRRRHDDAMALIWAEFQDSPHLARYRILKTHADRIGEWPAWREKALACVRQAIAAAQRAPDEGRWGWRPRPDRSELVRIFLWEKKPEAAWAEAQEGGCSDDLWLNLARKREDEHPEDTLAIYQQQVEVTLHATNREAYREAVGLLRKIRGLLVRLGRKSDFAQYLASVREAHKRKRNFMKLLDRARW